ncbi:hypothetical protein B5L90_09845 [Klebsiella pneumoniae]|nr:hypothetical protein B5L90_09845 [Klebsiella pneumoniae]
MINVLIVDDDAMVAELNRLYVARVPGFRCSASASTLSQAQEMINDPQQEIDLVLLDVYMQQDSGLDLLHYPLRRYRAAGLSLPPGRRTVQFA